MYEAVATGERHILGGVGLAICCSIAEPLCADGKRSKHRVQLDGGVHGVAAFRGLSAAVSRA